MNMNIERPTKVIELSLPVFKSNDGNSDCSINFYGMDAEVFRIVGKKPLGGYIGDEILKEGIGIKTMDKRQSCICKHPVLDARFYKEALKNDLRVKMFRIIENLIVVNFVSVEDAISFRMQYSHVVKMRFIRELIFDLSVKIPDSLEFKEKSNSIIKKVFPFNKDIPKKDLAVSTKQDSVNGMHNNRPFLQPSVIDNESTPNMTEAEFYSRVDFFSKMKGLHTKIEADDLATKLEKDRKDGFADFIANAKVLSVGSVTNVVMQSIIKTMTEEELCQLIKGIGNDISGICATKYGAYTIQTLILACTTSKTQNLLCKYFGQNGKYLFSHEIGNYSIQGILLFNEDYVFDLIKENLESIIATKLGVKVVKRCIRLLKNRRAEIEAVLAKIVTDENVAVCREIMSVFHQK